MCMNDIDICRFLVIIVGTSRRFCARKLRTHSRHGLQGLWFSMLFAPFMQQHPFSFLVVSTFARWIVNTSKLISTPGHTHIRDCRTWSDHTLYDTSVEYIISSAWRTIYVPGKRALYGDCWLDEYVSHAVLAWINPSVPMQVSSLMMPGVNRRTLLSAGATWILIVSLMRYVFYLCWHPYWLGSQYHTRESQVTFDTEQGKSITAGLNQLAVDFDLNFTYGTAPHDFTITQYVLCANS